MRNAIVLFSVMVLVFLFWGTVPLFTTEADDCIECGDGYSEYPMEEECDGDCECEGSCEEPAPRSLGGPKTHPSVGVCSVSPNTGAWQCRAMFPTFADPDYTWYEECRSNTRETEKSCITKWAELKNYKTCGPTIGGAAVIPYLQRGRGLTHREAAYQCVGEKLSRYSELFPWGI